MAGTLDIYLLTRECLSNLNNFNVMEGILKDRIINTRNILVRMFVSFQNYKKENIITLTESNFVIEEINTMITELSILESKQTNVLITNDDLINELQEINNKISIFMKTYGSACVYDMLITCFGLDYLDSLELSMLKKLKILNDTFHPIGYKSVLWSLLNRNGSKESATSSFFEDIHICETANTLDLYPILKFKNESLILKVHGGKLIFCNSVTEQTLIIYGYFENIPVNYLNSMYINERINKIELNKPSTDDFNDYLFDIFVKSLTLRDILTFDNLTLYDMFIGYKTFIKQLKNKPLSKITREFMNNDLFEKRSTMLKLLIYKKDFELQFIAYLLYDLLSIDDKDNESQIQTILFESLPEEIKNNFKGAMKQTIEYTNKLTSNLEIQNNLPYEQRICLLKTKESVKEKAMTKLKELKSKSEDSGSKARQYLDGLLKIPFGIYRNEPILEVLKNNKEIFIQFLRNNKDYDYYMSDNNLSSIEVLNRVDNIIINKEHENNFECSQKINQLLEMIKRKEGFIELVKIFNEFTHKYGLQELVINKYWNKNEIKEEIFNFICNNPNETKLFIDVLMKQKHMDFENKNKIPTQLLEIKGNYNKIQHYLKDVNDTLNKSVHGHKNAKKHIERILGQWLNGEQTGYCFGFEGPPGVGKTSLAKYGLSNCLKDENGESRPFAFIAIGGSSNGSTLDGHNYTYVGSMWGKIVDILMETKCMNPIIFIDEVDKVSRTESGREIIGILTHLVDPTQNDEFQDKYFTGIDLDLSKALFVFSYNDVTLMDRILLDRIHRIKFDHLSMDDKVTICENYMLPEIFEKMGQKNNIIISRDVIEFIIEEYTCEAGVRKMKEILFEIIGEINLEFLRENCDLVIPYEVTIENLKEKYLKNREALKPKKIPKHSGVGIINGLWANSLGKGGIIPIESSFIIANNMLELKLTGMQGDVMKESMSVAKTLAWKLTDDSVKEKFIEKVEKTKTQGIHIHCPDGSTPKDGPSAGTAITVVLYSLINKKKIKNTIAITGEINLQGEVTAIGGLDLKILGGIQGGVKTFLFPTENEKDFKKFMEKYKENPIIKGIEFLSISSIEEALKLALE